MQMKLIMFYERPSHFQCLLAVAEPQAMLNLRQFGKSKIFPNQKVISCFLVLKWRILGYLQLLVQASSFPW